MTRNQLIEQIWSKQSYLCVGLDTDISKIPTHLLSEPDPVFAFNKAIIDATQDLCVSYKINTAFYEAMGIEGLQAMQKTVAYIPKNIFTIADAKRGDIGNTASQYAKAFFRTYDFDAITVAPYMGKDSVQPFLEFEGKWAIVLGITSNAGANDFQKAMVSLGSGQAYLYETVIKKVASWGTSDNLMFVIGATQAKEFTRVRNIVPDHFFLVPGVGTQGGSLQEISDKAMNEDVGLLVNVSRAILYASEKEDFAEEARAIAAQYQFEMKTYLQKRRID